MGSHFQAARGPVRIPIAPKDGVSAPIWDLNRAEGKADPWPGSTAYLLYDHLALVQDEAHERGGATLAIRATDKAFATLTLASRGALAEPGTAPSALVRKLRLPR
jgi:hypothetical protein